MCLKVHIFPTLSCLSFVILHGGHPNSTMMCLRIQSTNKKSQINEGRAQIDCVAFRCRWFNLEHVLKKKNGPKEWAEQFFLCLCVSSCGHISIRCARALHDDTGWLLLVNREIQVCLLFVCLLFAACMLACWLACLLACCLLACLWSVCYSLAVLLASWLVCLHQF